MATHGKAVVGLHQFLWSKNITIIKTIWNSPTEIHRNTKQLVFFNKFNSKHFCNLERLTSCLYFNLMIRITYWYTTCLCTSAFMNWIISKSPTRKLALTDKNGLVGPWVKRETVGTKNYYKPLLEKVGLNLILLNTSKWYYDFEIFTSQNHSNSSLAKQLHM